MLKAKAGLCDNCRLFGVLPSGDWTGAVRAQGFHESTHIGDEYTIAARRLFPAEFARVNVTYEALDLGLSLESLLGETHPFKLRGGVIALLDPGAGYYHTDTLETAGQVLTGSHNRAEPYAGVEYRNNRNECGSVLPRWACRFYVSVDARHKTVYSYFKPSDDTPEPKQWSVNTVVGFWRAGQTADDQTAVAPYVRFYYGVNPFGQFRSQRDYMLFGLGFHLDR